MKILGIIPARFGSSRFPGKPLIDLKGKSMIQRVYEGAQRCALLEEVLVATDDQRIYDHVFSFGGKIVMTDSAHRSGTERCAEALQKHPSYDIVINIQGDEPLVDAQQLQSLCEVLKDGKVDIATLGILSENAEEFTNPNRVKLVKDVNNNALYFSRSPIPNNIHRNPPSPFSFWRHIGLYGYKGDVLLSLVKLAPTNLEQTESLEQLRWLYHGYKIRVVPTTIETPNIDSPDDLDKVLSLL